MKLVRDKIPRIIEQKGDKAVCRILDETDFYKALQDKLIEETKEFLEVPCVEELADILEVVYALAAELNISLEELELQRTLKAKKNGSFKKHIALEKVIKMGNL